MSLYLAHDFLLLLYSIKADNKFNQLSHLLGLNLVSKYMGERP